MHTQFNRMAPDPAAIPRPLTMQEYKATLDRNYVADQYRTWDQLLWQNDAAWQQEYEELQCKNERLRVEQMQTQKVSRGSAQTVHINKNHLQNSTALGAVDITARQPELAQASQLSVYIPVMELHTPETDDESRQISHSNTIFFTQN